MKDKERLQKILDSKVDSLEGICNTLDGATDWCKAFLQYKTDSEDLANKEEIFKVMLAYADAYIKYIETKQAIKVLKFVLDIPDENK